MTLFPYTTLFRSEIEFLRVYTLDYFSYLVAIRVKRLYMNLDRETLEWTIRRGPVEKKRESAYETQPILRSRRNH